MAERRTKPPLAPSDDCLDLVDVAQNLPSSAPVTRSLSKSCLRDPSQKQPPPPRAQVIDRAEDDISVQPSAQVDDSSLEHLDGHQMPSPGYNTHRTCSAIEQLPREVLDKIISQLGGKLGSIGSSSSTARNWSTVLRHPRRQDISSLALVSPVWRDPVQERIFRHIKIQGTQPALAELADFMRRHPHLKDHLRHLQVIIPIWETKKDAVPSQNSSADVTMENRDGSVFRLLFGQGRASTGFVDHQNDIAQIFRPATERATLAEIFSCAQALFPDLCALTIESAHCKRPPQVKFFRQSPSGFVPSHASKPDMRIPSPAGPDLPILPSVRVLVLRGAWNLIREPSELELISKAIPNLQDINCSYHTPKTKPYITMCAALRTKTIPSSIRHVNLCLEGLYSKMPDSLAKWKKVYPEHHICRTLGEALPQLESLTYTGRVCGALFSEASKRASNRPQDYNRTKRIDIIVKNVCRDPKAAHDGAGIHHWPFIQAFETIVVKAMHALAVYPNLEFLRIRFIDLDSPDGPLNPAFHMERGKAWGFWSDQILEPFYRNRPSWSFVPAWPSDFDVGPNGEKSISMTHYRNIINNLANRLY